MQKQRACDGQLSMKSFFAGTPKHKPETPPSASPMETEGSETKSSKRGRSDEDEAVLAKSAKPASKVTPIQRHSTPIARTEATCKRPTSASTDGAPSSSNASAVCAAIRASSDPRPSPPAGSGTSARASFAHTPSPLARTGAAPNVNERALSYRFLRDKRDAQGRREGEAGFDKSTLLVQLKGDERFTPGQQQYWDIKRHHNDVIIFFKMGKFYELFEEDALVGHRELDLSFMGKDSPHVGFPEAALGKYAEKLVSLGYKVGVVEQMETPQQLEERNKLAPKGQKDKAVRRELCSVLTKGVAFHRDDAATYLLSVCEDGAGTLGVCFVDAASGKFSLGQCCEDASNSRLLTLLTQLRPAEVVVDESRISRSAFTLLRRSVPEGLFNMLPPSAFWDAEEATSQINSSDYFHNLDNAAWPKALQDARQSSPVALAAFGGCVSYLRKLLLDKQLLSLGAVNQWQPTDATEQGARHLILDAKALENLEVFENSSDKGSKGTLFSVVDLCASPFGKRTLRSWLCCPLARLDDIHERQQAVAALIESSELRKLLQTELRKLPDLERLVATINAFSIAQASNQATNYTDIGRKRLNEFIRCLEGFEALAAMVEKAQTLGDELRETSPLLAQALTKGDGFPAIDAELASLRGTFDWQAAKSEGRVVPKEGADDDHDAAKRDLEAATARLEEIRREWQKHFGDRSIEYWMPAGSTTEPFQLVVSEETLKRKGTPDEFTLMSQKKGWRRFWDEDIREQVGVYLEAKERLEHALAQGANRLFGRFAKFFALWNRAVSCAAELDCLVSLARVSSSPGMCRPVFVEQQTPFLEIRQGVNTCVQASRPGADCIPNDILIGKEDDGLDEEPRMLLVTGPNMGGKSTILRQACLTTLMAHLGCWVSASSCRLTPVDRIFTRVGANDAIMAGLSTFRIELEETAQILHHATERSLVILDELGRCRHGRSYLTTIEPWHPSRTQVDPMPATDCNVHPRCKLCR
ncbi:hypothetical protein AB1Y20_023022 [Prymnesium parvum]|uniref:DNA mismatch repair protein n=1 Tax=Prymnesium parvum TaxID=97485 RepID=A0AB34JF72_PRYPA